MIQFVYHQIVPAAYALLPPSMQSAPATAMLLSIGLQESRFTYRRQVNGPAKSFWQFELGGIAGVRRHALTRPHLTAALRTLQYSHTLSAAKLHEAIEDNDILALVCARLLLWTVPGELPARDEPDRAWDQYYSAWRPGRPHPETFAEYFETAWQLVSTS